MYVGSLACECGCARMSGFAIHIPPYLLIHPASLLPGVSNNNELQNPTTNATPGILKSVALLS